MYDALVIGGGVNGLVAGALLAQRKLSTLILERQSSPGGAAVTAELAPGFRVPRLSHALGPMRRDVLRALGIDRARLDLVEVDPLLTSLGRSGRTLVFHRDPVLTAGAINEHSAEDAGRWRGFLLTAQRFGRLAAALSRRPPPSIDTLSAAEVWTLLQIGRDARALGRRDLARLVRWLPMPVADLASEWFATELVRAAIASRAVFGNFAGPRSPGTGAVLLQRLAEDVSPVGGGITMRGGPGALAQTLATVARDAGAHLRTNTRVARIQTRDGRAVGVTLDDGDELEARAVVSAVDPRQTFLQLVDPEDLAPSFVERIGRYRARGVTAKVNLALSRLPEFDALRGDPVPLRGRLLVAPDLEYLERAFDAAKYGRFSPEPWMELVVPSVVDETLAPPGAHVMSIYVHYAPRELRGAGWSGQRDSLYRTVLQALGPHIPDLDSAVVARDVITPEDLEREWGLSGGHIFHGEPTLDQTWMARPLLGWSQYRTPITGLYLAGAGAHPGGGLTGGSGLLAARTVLQDFRRRDV
jgi:phytoene dehydrogenase-like protein